MLQSAAENATAKADVLCRAAGVARGDLLSIDYSWGEMRLYSKTRYELEDCEEEACESRGINVQPEDINISDTATFVWEIKSC